MLAAIDAGSNTLRLLIGEADNGTVIPHSYHRRITRLAGGFTEEEGLSEEACERTLAAFLEFAEICRKEGVTHSKAVGTAAFRKAVNGQVFANRISEACGIKLNIIDGNKEAFLMATGVLSALNPLPDISLIMDIGGGSTEFVLCCKQAVLWQTSLPLGVVRLTESLQQEDRIKFINDLTAQLPCILEEYLKDKTGTLSPLQLVGTAGTVTTLAALDMQMQQYDWKRVNNLPLSIDRINHWQSVLQPLTVAEREAFAGMEEGRGDLIMAGIEIILNVMEKLNFTSMIVSDFGILEGLLLSQNNTGKS